MNYQHLVLGFLSISTAFAWMGSAQAATLTHNYNLGTTGLADTEGGASLVAGGGTLSSAGYAFGANQGLTLSNSINPSSYSIFLDFSLSDASQRQYNKIVDFKALTVDDGVYVKTDTTSLVSYYANGNDIIAGATPVADNAPLKLALTRDASGQVSTYLNGVQQFSFLGVSGIVRDSSVFFTPNSIINFFNDDVATGGSEAASGLVSQISIYDGALSASEASILTGSAAASTAVPEPFTIVGTLIGGTAAMRMRKKLKAKDKV